MTAITLALTGGDNVQLTGFGRFLVRDYIARTGRNCNTPIFRTTFK